MGILFMLLIAAAIYVPLLLRNGIISVKRPVFEDFILNLEFNESAMKQWCELYDTARDLDVVEVVRKSLMPISVCCILLFLVPLKLVTLAVITVVLYAFLPKNPGRSESKRSVDQEGDNERMYVVYENQRWWLGSWTDKALSLGTSHIFPWSDKSGQVPSTKTRAVLPGPEWEWDCPWHVDPRGWEYATGFTGGDGEFHPYQSPTDFVRRRQWVRRCVKKQNA